MVDKKNFYIPQIEEEEKDNKVVENKPKEKDRYIPDQFVSPISGRNVKDEVSFPSVSYNNGGKQYDSFRDDDKKQRNDYSDYIIKTESSYSNAQTRNAYGGNNPIYKEEVKASPSPYQEYNEAPYVNPRVIDNNPYKEEEEVKYPTYEQNESNNLESVSPYENNESIVNDDIESIFEEVKREEIVEEENEEIVKPRRVNLNETSSDKQYKPKLEMKKKYYYPPLSLVRKKPADQATLYSGVEKQRDIINKTLEDFGVGGRVVNFTKGPTVTLFEIQLNPGVNYNKIPPLQYNFQGNLEAVSIRLECPIPGKSTVGIEVPNIDRDMVYFGDLISDEKFLHDDNPLNVLLGMDISGKPVYVDIGKMPHGLIAGCTGSGKSVCINSTITNILFKAHPDDVKLILIDPKKVEFSKFRGIPHLATPIITDPKLAVASLKWAVDEMENRYELFSSVGASKYKEYLEITGGTKEVKHLPYIVIIIDEFADLILNCPDVEESVMKLTQKARAAGIHLLVATQRPSVNVINGTIKTNIPSRIAFKVNKPLDSNIILDRPGAEKLLGNGDMLYVDELGVSRRIQGAYISDSEIRDVVSYINDNYDGEFLIATDVLEKKSSPAFGEEDDALNDELFVKIARYVVDTQNASINKIQKTFGCGFNRASAIIDKLEELNIVSENLGSRARTVLVEPEDLEDILNNL